VRLLYALWPWHFQGLALASLWAIADDAALDRNGPPVPLAAVGWKDAKVQTFIDTNASTLAGAPHESTSYSAAPNLRLGVHDVDHACGPHCVEADKGRDAVEVEMIQGGELWPMQRAAVLGTVGHLKMLTMHRLPLHTALQQPGVIVHALYIRRCRLVGPRLGSGLLVALGGGFVEYALHGVTGAFGIGCALVIAR
jgi:hypothetical protein